MEVGGSPQRSASTPALPPLTGKLLGSGRGAGGGRGAAGPAARVKGQAAQRQEFLSGLLNEDLQKLTVWHGSRPAHEQKRFLRSVNTLYKAFESAEDGTWSKQAKQNQAKQQQAESQALAEALRANAAAMARASVEDPLNGPPRETPRALAASSSEPILKAPAQPIEVFEQRKRKGRVGDPDYNSLATWLDGQSISSQTTATTQSSQGTRFSQLTMTSDGGSSICSEPGTTNQLAYRIHKRAAAANKRKFNAVSQHVAGALKDGIPNSGFPDCERMATQYKDAYGDAKSQGAHVTKQMYQSVLQDNSHPFVEKFLDTATPDHKDQFADLLRSLEYLRKAHVSQNMSVQREEMNLAENRRLWHPPRQKPVFDTSQINYSRVPLGNLQQGPPGAKTAAAPAPPPEQHHRPQPPPSPSVSGLGSLPLSRLSTPAVL
mmetsp:Transcript_107336/g.308912  ORF Transcript_107336/g.308912 Transcript_107336/m.308912 type:complete len:433 (-) Transcript_107336:187-1485(-)